MNFKKTTIILFSIITVLLSLTLFLFLYLVAEVENDGTIINIAGRQRMLSQKVTKLCMQIAYNPDSITNQNKVKELETTLILFETSHYGLINGDKELNLHINNSNIILELFSNLQSHFEKITTTAKEFTDREKSNSDILETIFEGEKEFLFLMNKIVFQYDKENSQKMKRLKIFMIMLTIFIIAVLFLELILVLLPIIKKEKVNSIRLIESNKTKDKFFSIIAHDLKNPFNAMLGFSNELNENFDKYDKEEQKEFLGIIHKSIKNTYKLLDNLLLWSRSQKGDIVFNPERINLYLLANESNELLSQSAENKTIKIINQIPKNIYVDADKDMLSTIIRNLLSNAVKFTPKGGEITIKAHLIIIKNNQAFTEITIEDNGVGISKEIQLKLFDISENASTQGTEDEKGTGLGLILCKEFVEKHSGKIWIESEIGKGSRFIFTIPVFLQTDRF